MTSIKVKFRPSSVAGHEGTIYYQIIHERKPRQLLSGYRIFPDEWDTRREMVVATQNDIRQPLVRSIRERIRKDIERLKYIVGRMEADNLKYTSDEVIEEYNRYLSEYSLFRFMENTIDTLRMNGKTRTSETYTATLNSFKKFRNDEDIMLDSISSEVMEAYEAWHRKRGIAPNTISFYTRILRAIYNRAVENGIIENRNPFHRVYTGVDKTIKRALPLQTIKGIKNLDLSQNPALDFARDMFMMSFMLRGMSFIDMAYLRKTDLVNRHIVYRRRKTGQQLSIEWTRDMQRILDKYPENRSDYLLPIIRKRETNERFVYKNAGERINRNLKCIARLAGVTIPLSLYVARHSWASIAKAKGIPIGVISEGMGHDSEMTTKIYLASLDSSVVDKANSIILGSL